MSRTLQEYLIENWNNDAIDHMLRVYVDGEGRTCFYIHPADIDGETLDFAVEDNEVELINSKTIDPELVSEAG